MSRRVIPISPLRGVRISWLMLARNSDLSREAWRAASRARTSTSMFCSTTTTPSTRRPARRQGCMVHRM